MYFIFGLIALAVVIVLLYIRTESLSREHKRLLVQYKMLEQDSIQLQQHTYELAEEFSRNLLAQLNATRRMTRLPEDSVHIFEICLHAMPLICKEISFRQQSMQMAMQRYLKMQGELTLPQVEAELNRHGRLIPHWQKQSFAGYLQLCQQFIVLMRENALKETLREVETA